MVAALFLCVSSGAQAQDSAADRPSTVAEEQDFVFAAGLYRDSLYQMAGEQFDAFIQKHPYSTRLPDVQFLGAECRFRLGKLTEAVQGYTEFLRSYPSNRLVPDAHFRKGQAYLQLKRNPEAIAEFRTILDQFGDNILAGESAYWIGEGYLKNGDYENAIKYYSIAYEGYPSSSVRDYALYSLGWTYQKKKEYPRAIQWYEKLLAEYPGGRLAANGHLRLGECAYEVGEYRRALAEADAAGATRAGRVEDVSSAAFLAAEAQYQLGTYSDAASRYERFLQEYPAHPLAREAAYGLGWSYLKMQKSDSAAVYFARLAVGTDGIAQASLYRLGVLFSDRGAKDSALTTLLGVPARFPDGEYAARALYDAASILYGQARWDDARKRYEQLVSIYPSSDVAPDATRMVGECLLQAGDDAAAATWFAKAVSASGSPVSTRSQALFQQAWSAFKLRQYHEASELFGRFTKEFPQLSQAHEARFWRGEALYASGEYREALEAYRSASDTSAGRYRENALYGMGWCLLKLGRFSDAVVGFERVVAEYPKGRFCLDARLRMGDAYLAAKEYKSAAGSYQTVVRMFPDSLSTLDYAYYQLGQSLQKEGDHAGAYKAFEVLTKVLPASPLADDAQYAMGWINFQKKEFSEAIKEFQKLLRLYPESDQAPRALCSLGDAYYNQRMYVPAEKSYREVLRRYPASRYASEAVTGIQYCLVALGRAQDAYSVIDEYVKDNPDASNVEDLTLRKAELLVNRKKLDEAVREYRGFLVRYPKSPLKALATYWLAECYRLQGNLDQAAQTFEQAGTVPDPKPPISAKALLEAGKLYGELKQDERAVSAFDRAEAQASSSDVKAEACFFRGSLYEARGNRAEASAQYESVIRLFPREYAADESRVRLARLLATAEQPLRAVDLAREVASGRTDALGAEAQYVVGLVRAIQKDWATATKEFLRIRYVYPTAEQWIARAYVRMGEAYEQLHDLTKARDAYSRAVRMKKVPDAAQEAAQRLDALERK